MDELDSDLQISVTGTVREEALAACARQLRAWDVALPPVEPLVLDFGLGDFYRTGLIEYWIANEIEAGYCGKFLFLFDRQTCPLHRKRPLKHLLPGIAVACESRRDETTTAIHGSGASGTPGAV